MSVSILGSRSRSFRSLDRSGARLCWKVFPMILFVGVGRERPEVLDGDSDGHATPFPARSRGCIGVEGGKWKDEVFEFLIDETQGSRFISKLGFSSGTPDPPRIPDPYQPSRTVGTDEGRDLPRISV